MAMAQAWQCVSCQRDCSQWISSTKAFDENKCILITARNVLADKPKENK